MRHGKDIYMCHLGASFRMNRHLGFMLVIFFDIDIILSKIVPGKKAKDWRAELIPLLGISPGPKLHASCP
ncbi:hypothetical protein [Brevibacillus sp. SIMBA_076]|uniref:hypothetical protein n=1 Tax=Brevibacillus sp. SIMBA_076 TaxID=3085814 RepID=UPI0039797B45